MRLFDELVADQMEGESKPSLAALAKKQPAAGTVIKKTGDAKPGPKVVWSADKSKWRYPAANTWYPSSVTPGQERKPK